MLFPWTEIHSVFGYLNLNFKKGKKSQQTSIRNQLIETNTYWQARVTQSKPHKICSEEEQRDLKHEELKTFFIERDYPAGIIEGALRKARSITRKQALRKIVAPKELTRRPVLQSPGTQGCPQSRPSSWITGGQSATKSKGWQRFLNNTPWQPDSLAARIATTMLMGPTQWP